MNGQLKPADPEMYRIVYAPEADAQLIQLYRYIAQGVARHRATLH